MSGVPEAFVVVQDLIMAREQHPLTRYDAPLHVPVDDTWECWINGSVTKERAIVDGTPNTMAVDMKVPPLTIAVFFNGWLGGLVDPGGGTLCAGEIGNEDAFIAAVRAAMPTMEESCDGSSEPSG